MPEYMLYIRNAGHAKAALSEADHLTFVKACELYIQKLKSDDKLIAAQPLLREGWVLSKTQTNWKQAAIDPAGEVQVGYYHIRASTIEEAIEIAKANPEFEYVPSASIEVHPIKTKEEKTNFIYPK
ncbi:MAG: hypothetical protein JSS93_04560 [Bacteroidetes bacterium]|nr:hypothetical protein [Bacteroidota bacterium]